MTYKLDNSKLIDKLLRMNKQSIRDIFDIISLNVIGFLENHIGISDVDFVERSGVAEMSITKWEEENSPFQLPDDYKAFL